MSTLNEKPFYDFVIQVKEKIRKAQYESLKAVNRELLSLYWDLGELIVQKQEAHSWGKSVVEELAKELEKEFPGTKGFSAANLWRMRNFYMSYKDNSILAPLVREISWSHNLAIFEKCKDNLEREFYIRMTIKYGWTKNVLIHHIENRSYEKYLLNQTNFDQAVPEKYRLQAKMAVKDEYTFDFLEMDDDHSEAELE
jgi:predicted nuclease of restriction endonuclease-like (RecB) superfamily